MSPGDPTPEMSAPERNLRAVLSSTNRLALALDAMREAGAVHARLVALAAGLPELARMSPGEAECLKEVLAATRGAASATFRNRAALENVLAREQKRLKDFGQDVPEAG